MILFYFDENRLGESQRAMVVLMQALAGRGVSLRALLPSANGELGERLRRAGIEFDVLGIPQSISGPKRGPIAWARAAWAGLGYYRKLARYFRMYHFDLVYSDGLRAHLLSIALKIRFNVPLAWSFWSVLPVGAPLWGFKLAVSVFCDHLAASSLFVAHQLGRSPRWRNKVAVVYRGYDTAGLESRPARANQAPVVVTAGELLPESGFKTFLRSLESVAEVVPEVRGTILSIGRGEAHEHHRRTMQSVVDDLGLGDRVTIEVIDEPSPATGVIGDLVRRNAGVYVNASVEVAPFHSDVAEAMAAGVPVIAARTGVLAELIINENTGLLTTAGDPAALTQGIVRLLRERALADTLTTNARQEFAARFSLGKYLERIEKIYGEHVVRADDAPVESKKAA